MYLPYVHSFSHSTSLPAHITPVTGPALGLWGACPVHRLNVHSTCNQNRYLKSRGETVRNISGYCFLVIIFIMDSSAWHRGKASHYALDFLSSYSQVSLLLTNLQGLPCPTGHAPPPPSSLCSLLPLRVCVPPPPRRAFSARLGPLPLPHSSLSTRSAPPGCPCALDPLGTL